MVRVPDYLAALACDDLVLRRWPNPPYGIATWRRRYETADGPAAPCLGGRGHLLRGPPQPAVARSVEAHRLLRDWAEREGLAHRVGEPAWTGRPDRGRPELPRRRVAVPPAFRFWLEPVEWTLVVVPWGFSEELPRLTHPPPLVAGDILACDDDRALATFALEAPLLRDVAQVRLAQWARRDGWQLDVVQGCLPLAEPAGVCAHSGFCRCRLRAAATAGGSPEPRARHGSLTGMDDEVMGARVQESLRRWRRAQHEIVVPADAGEWREPIRRLLERIPPGWHRMLRVERGWYPIVCRVDAALGELDPGHAVQQVKEKMGTLRYYWEPSASLPEEERERICALGEEHVRAAFLASTTTCERCGATPASLRMGGPVKTVCDRCRGEPYPWS